MLMLHGYGSQEHDLLSLAAHLPQEGFTYASMRAPQPVGSQFSADSTGAYIAADAIGYQWYPLNQQLESDQRAIEQASDYVLEWVRANREPYASVTLLASRRVWASQLRWCVTPPASSPQWWDCPATPWTRIRRTSRTRS